MTIEQNRAFGNQQIRLLMQMGANDSTNLIESVAASRLGENVMLVHDEATGQDQGFRPFDFDTLGELSQWVARGSHLPDTTRIT